MNITDLKIGETAIITNIKKSNNLAYIEELSAFGLNEGTKVTFVGKSTFGNLLHIKCNNSTFVLRKVDASLIEVGTI